MPNKMTFNDFLMTFLMTFKKVYRKFIACYFLIIIV